MIQLTSSQLKQKMQFIEKYISAENAADGSHLDANANVSHKNIATLEAEINKDINIQINRGLVKAKVSQLYGSQLADEYQRQIEAHEIYVHDETSLKPYCASITMYPFLLDGMTTLGGESQAPLHLESFCGSFINLVFAISAQFAGAVATVEFLTYFDYFARKDYGEDYLASHTAQIENHLQHIVYSVNQPAAARGYQSVFWNISVYDENYFASIFENFVFPDGELPQWKSVQKLQEFFLSWFNKERQRALLTFPVVTAAMLVDDTEPLDAEFASICAQQLAEGNSFFIYQSKSPDSLASCCRLRNEISDNTFSYTLGAGGVSTGSINVITLNLNRLIQDGRDLKEEVEKTQKYQVSYRTLVEDYLERGLLPVYQAGYISLDKQFLTIGINGMVEAAESQGISAKNDSRYRKFVSKHLKIIYEANIAARKKYGYLFNTEFVPAENLGPKNAKWDREDGYAVQRDCYNSYFYAVEDRSINAVEKFQLHGKDFVKYLDGGSALHLNLDENLSKENFANLLKIAARTGCNYFCTNVKVTICNDCGHIDKATRSECQLCHSPNVDYGTRVIGYLKRIGSFSSPRQMEHRMRYYHREKRQQSLS